MRVKKKRSRKAPRIRFPLRELLRTKGLTQYKCAQMAGVTQQQVSDLCIGRKLPSWPMLLRICTAIGADLGELAPRGVAV